MTSLPPQLTAGTMKVVDAAIIEVDFHLKADVEHTYGLLADISPPGPVTVGQRLLATDGEITVPAIVDEVDEERGSLLLRVLWDQQSPAA